MAKNIKEKKRRIGVERRGDRERIGEEKICGAPKKWYCENLRPSEWSSCIWDRDSTFNLRVTWLGVLDFIGFHLL